MVIILQLIFMVLSLLALVGSIKSMMQGPPKDVSQQLDSVYRFMAGVYFGVGIICLWLVFNLEGQEQLVYLLALTVFTAGIGRTISIVRHGTSDRKFYVYACSELGLPAVMAILNYLRS